jgi:ribosomal protein L14E/L6E/L27E
MGFKGSTLKREFDYADKLKPSTNDTVYTATGKLQTLKALHDIAVTKNSLIDLYLKDSKITPAQAVEKANKAVDIKAIDKRVKELTAPAVKIDNPKTKASMWITVKRAKELGFTKDQAKKFGLKYE